MPLINDQQIPSVELDFMNHDHAEAASQVNQLHDTLSRIAEGDDSASEEVEPILLSIFKHSEEHFGREEAEMVRVNFPAYDCHKGEHERVLAELKQILALWQENQDSVLLMNYVTNTLPDWLRNHIASMDTVTAMFVRRHDMAAA